MILKKFIVDGVVFLVWIDSNNIKVEKYGQLYASILLWKLQELGKSGLFTIE